MRRRTRALLLAALAVLLGTLAAGDVAGREAALQARIGAAVPVVVARTDIPAGTMLRPALLGVRAIPARYVPVLSFGRPGQLAGRRTAVALPRGTALVTAMLAAGTDSDAAAATAALRPGERVADLLATGSARGIVPGGRVDVLVTRERADGSGVTRLALAGAEVLAVAPAPPADHDGAPRLRVSLRVGVQDAIALAQAQNFAREIRVLARPPNDEP